MYLWLLTRTLQRCHMHPLNAPTLQLGTMKFYHNQRKKFLCILTKRMCVVRFDFLHACASTVKEHIFKSKSAVPSHQSGWEGNARATCHVPLIWMKDECECVVSFTWVHTVCETALLHYFGENNVRIWSKPVISYYSEWKVNEGVCAGWKTVLWHYTEWEQCAYLE